MKCLFTLGLLIFIHLNAISQLSPGDLTKAHAQFEGMSNCTQCHVIGAKVTNDKCTECHKEIKNLISNSKGYHASSDVKGKDCFACHSEHHGRNFQIIRIDEAAFKHSNTGYVLEGKHSQINCKDCHKPDLIKNKISKKKEGTTYLGLTTDCKACHTDNHQQTLSTNCALCHGNKAFAPAEKFNHATTSFPLKGQHAKVDCIKCHPKNQLNGKPFQQFKGVIYNNCTACHTDVHDNKFGQTCTKCHNEQSFHQVSQIKGFDHSQTNFPLQGQHQTVDCKSCHKQSLTTPMAHVNCTDCHTDYHQGQLKKQGQTFDCKDCHTVNGFTPSLFAIEKHEQANFKLTGAHMATPCFVCHKPADKWTFKAIGLTCVNCHENIHKNSIEPKFMPDQKCETCHSTNTWSEVLFNHNPTGFELTGKHATISCKNCHFKPDGSNKPTQQFDGLTNQCSNCHNDIHRDQFKVDGKTLCDRCHGFENWKPDKFNHNEASFKLEGAHLTVDCKKCHTQINDATGSYTRYKLNNEIKCADCHL